MRFCVTLGMQVNVLVLPNTAAGSGTMLREKKPTAKIRHSNSIVAVFICSLIHMMMAS